MSLAENGVVYFLADPVKSGYVVIAVLSTSMALNGIVSHIAYIVELFEEIHAYDVVSVEYDDMIIIACIMLYCILHGLRLGTFVECGLKKVYVKLGKRMVG